MILRTLTVVDVSHLFVDEVYYSTMNTSTQAKASEWYREAVCDTHRAEWEHVDFVFLWAIGPFFNGFHLVAWRFHFPTPRKPFCGKSLSSTCWELLICGCQSPSCLAGCRLLCLRRTFLNTSSLLPMPYHASTS